MFYTVPASTQTWPRHHTQLQPHFCLLPFAFCHLICLSPVPPAPSHPSVKLRVSMRVKVLFFGMLKDIVGRVEEQVELGPGARLSTVFDHYAGQFPRLRDMSGSIVMARNQEFSGLSTAVSEGDEVAFLPPVSGGLDIYTHEITDAQGNFYALTRQPID